MPEMDGYEVARRIRELPDFREVTLIALTGWGQEKDRRRSRMSRLRFPSDQAGQRRRPRNPAGFPFEGPRPNALTAPAVGATLATEAKRTRHVMLQEPVRGIHHRLQDGRSGRSGRLLGGALGMETRDLPGEEGKYIELVDPGRPAAYQEVQSVSRTPVAFTSILNRTTSKPRYGGRGSRSQARGEDQHLVGARGSDRAAFLRRAREDVTPLASKRKNGIPKRDRSLATDAVLRPSVFLLLPEGR